MFNPSPCREGNKCISSSLSSQICTTERSLLETAWEVLEVRNPTSVHSGFCIMRRKAECSNVQSTWRAGIRCWRPCICDGFGMWPKFTYCSCPNAVKTSLSLKSALRSWDGRVFLERQSIAIFTFSFKPFIITAFCEHQIHTKNV